MHQTVQRIQATHQMHQTAQRTHLTRILQRIPTAMLLMKATCLIQQTATDNS